MFSHTFIPEPYLFAAEFANVADLPASLNKDFFSQTAPLASSNIGFFPQTSTDVDFFTMANHALANAYDTTNADGVVNYHSNAVPDNFLDQFGPSNDFQV